MAVPESKRRTAEMLRALGTTADGMAAIAPGGEILTWNEAARELLGYSAEEVVGQKCFDVFAWLDRCGNPVCSAFCPDCRSVQGDEHVATREAIARSKAGRDVWLSVSTLVPPPELRGECRLVHLFREAGLPPALERLVVERIARGILGEDELSAEEKEKASALDRLTPREHEVLQLIVAGKGTQEIAEELTVSLTTVRNHVRHILKKLDVHTKLEAAVLFVRHNAERG